MRLVSVLCCLVWASGSSGMLPAVVAFLGAFDSVHEVLVMENHTGTTIVFHHQTKEAEALERHSLFMQVVTVVTATSGESNDHVMGFSNVVDCKAGSVRAAVEASAPACTETPLSLSAIALHMPREGVLSPPSFRNPPPSCAAFSRGTQLRI